LRRQYDRALAEGKLKGKERLPAEATVTLGEIFLAALPRDYMRKIYLISAHCSWRRRRIARPTLLKLFLRAGRDLEVS
jgi:hypothetical protein